MIIFCTPEQAASVKEQFPLVDIDVRLTNGMVGAEWSGSFPLEMLQPLTALGCICADDTLENALRIQGLEVQQQITQ